MIRRFFSFQGRAARQEWWVVTLLVGIGQVGVEWGIGRLVGYDFSPAAFYGDVVDQSDVSFVAMVLFTWMGWMLLAPVHVRRLHDRGRSGWWYLGGLVSLEVMAVISDYYRHPLLSWIEVPELASTYAAFAILGFVVFAFVYVGLLRGTVGVNRFGPDPLDPEAEARVFD